VGLRLGERDARLADPHLGRQGALLALAQATVVPSGELLDHLEADVVARAVELASGGAETDHQQVGRRTCAGGSPARRHVVLGSSGRDSGRRRDHSSEDSDSPAPSPSPSAPSPSAPSSGGGASGSMPVSRMIVLRVAAPWATISSGSRSVVTPSGSSMSCTCR